MFFLCGLRNQINDLESEIVEVYFFYCSTANQGHIEVLNLKKILRRKGLESLLDPWVQGGLVQSSTSKGWMDGWIIQPGEEELTTQNHLFSAIGQQSRTD